jgi:glycerol-3-phosphate dehydrogenase
MSTDYRIRRASQIENLKSSKFDVIVIGAGATGAGAALDAATRGLTVALVDRGDFAGGTSSRSTKLLHGGVRYLEKAVKGLDCTQLDLVRGALRERQTLLRLAPHLVRKLGIITPLYAAWQIPYLLTGLKLYDLIAGQASFGRSQYLTRKETLRRFPQVQDRGLWGGVLYFDGQFDDARMNVELALTAREEGATICNYLEVIGLTKDTENKVVGVDVRDKVGHESFTIRGRAVINATGPYADAIRTMDDPESIPLLRVSSGAHVVVEQSVCPRDVGMLIPKTKDGRVLFVLPWHGHTVIGTTDEDAKVVDEPTPTAAEIEYLLEHINKYLKRPLQRSDVLAQWSGLRPLVQSRAESSSTAALSRDHHISVSPSGLLTITGGKWTTYRLMAEDVIDKAVAQAGLMPRSGSGTLHRCLVGASEEIPSVEELQAEFKLDRDVAGHLRSTYGSRSRIVGRIARDGASSRLSSYFPIIAAEARYAVEYEMAATAQDFVARRVRAAFTNQVESQRMLPMVRECIDLVEH